MQYIMITSRCNMTCSHCAFSCNGVREDMSFDVFKTAIDRWSPLLLQNNEVLMIGGGEPTIHPEFWKFLFYALKKVPVWLATNGKKTMDFMLLTKMSRENKLYMTLSIDKYHDKIDQRSVKFFKEGLIRKKGRPGWETPMKGIKNREIRTVVELKKSGRCLTGVKRCPCPRMHIKPNGDIFGCGCEDAKQIGTVENGFYKEYLKYIPQLKDNNPKFRMCSKRWLKI